MIRLPDSLSRRFINLGTVGLMLEWLTDMVCSDAGEGDNCWGVMYNLTLPACWNEDFTEPQLCDECLSNVPCNCLFAYEEAYNKLTPAGKVRLEQTNTRFSL